MTKLKIDNVKKIYQTRKGEMTALNGVNLDIKENELPATCLRGARYREGMTQVELASKTGIPVRHISEMENEKRPIGAKNARLLGEILNIDPRLFRKI